MDKPYCTTQHVGQPVRSSSDGVSGQEAASGPPFWPNRCEVTSLPPPVAIAAAAAVRGAPRGLWRTRYF